MRGGPSHQHFFSYLVIHKIEGVEYWFPRPLEPGKNHPLVILGWGPERYMDDDSCVNSSVAKHLRELLPSLFEGKFEQGNEPEMEWVRSLIPVAYNLITIFLR